jgi:hypothetical protein
LTYAPYFQEDRFHGRFDRWRRRAVRITVIVVTLGSAMWLYQHIRNRPIDILERLNDPRRLVTWTDSSLKLSGGVVVPLPEVRGIQWNSPVLYDLSANGIEVCDGHAYGLVRIWHWCGNDRVRTHIARVDVAQLLLFTQDVQATDDEVQQCIYSLGRRRGLTNSPWGWDISDFSAFRSFSQYVETRVKTNLGTPAADAVPIRFNRRGRTGTAGTQ